MVRINRRQRASALIGVFVLMFVLLTLITGLHWRQASSRSSLFHQEANLQARIAAEYQLARQIRPDCPFQLTGQVVSASSQEAQEVGLTSAAAKNLFSKSDLLELSKIRTSKLLSRFSIAGGAAWNLVRTSSSDPALRPDRAQYLSVVSQNFPYAACAPRGRLTLGETLAWRNQLFGKTNQPPDQAYSGGIARVAAGGDISIARCEYGEAFSQQGSIAVLQGRVLGYAGPPADLQGPMAFPQVVESQVREAMLQLSARAQDKTSLMNGSLLSVETVFQLFSGKISDTLARALSLRQAMQFPFFMIPGGRVKGIIVNLWLHMPYAPDGGSQQARLNNVQGANQSKLDSKLDEIEKKNLEIQDLESKSKAETDPGKRQQLTSQLQSAQQESQNQAKGLQQMQKDIDSQVESALQGSQAEGDRGPSNRAGEQGLDERGIEGFSYGPFYKKIFDFCLDCVVSVFTGKTPDLEKWAKSLYQEVRLVHFGGQDFATQFSISDDLTEFTATFNVPQGRAVKLTTDLKINGDLWLMRGATLVVEGDLTMANPNQGSLDPRLPRGRIFLEQGANLVVTGNVTCAGSEMLGSVLLGCPIGKVNPGLGGMLVGGNLTIPFGVWPAFSLGDLDLSEVPELEGLRDVMASVVPNLAKLSGPFHRRKPYFSRFATNFICACVLTPIGPLPVAIPAPIPTPDNANVKIFRALSLIYSVQMNLAWGENFLTHCDWWFLGQGMVPVFPKVDPSVYLDRLKNLKLPELPSAAEVEKLLKEQAPKLVEQMVPKLLSEVITKLVISQLSMGFGDLVLGVLPLEDWVNQVLGVEDTQKSLLEIAGLDEVARRIRDKVNEKSALMLLHELPGIFIYSGGNLEVGPCPLTVGMLLAKGNVVSRAAVTVGAVMSLQGNVETQKLYYLPNCTRTSLYLPRQDVTKITTMEWLDWALEYRYGRFFAGSDTLEIGPGLRRTTLEGWVSP